MIRRRSTKMQRSPIPITLEVGRLKASVNETFEPRDTFTTGTYGAGRVLFSILASLVNN